MGNVLNEEKRKQILALGRLGWSLRQIEEATGVRRETAAGYIRAAGIDVGKRGRHPTSSQLQTPKPAIEVTTGSGEVDPPNPAIPVNEVTAGLDAQIPKQLHPPPATVSRIEN